MAAEAQRIFFWLSMMFCGNFLQVKVKEKQTNKQTKTVFIVFLGLKDLSG